MTKYITRGDRLCNINPWALGLMQSGGFDRAPRLPRHQPGGYFVSSAPFKASSRLCPDLDELPSTTRQPSS
jgi:hypothetical protein